MITPTSTTITALSKRLGIDKHTIRQVIDDLSAGVGIMTIRKISSLGYQRVRAIARACEWTPADRRHVPPDLQGPVGGLTRARVLELFDQGMSMPSIGRLAGVSHERIRQIAQAAGRPSRLITKRKRAEIRGHWLRLEGERRAAARAIAIAATRQRRLAFMEKAKQMWAAGASHKAIARAYGVPFNSMAWYIHSHRQRFGEQDFPRRTRDLQRRHPL